jgi:hypothetical protein
MKLLELKKITILNSCVGGLNVSYYIACRKGEAGDHLLPDSSKFLSYLHCGGDLGRDSEEESVI